MRNARREEEKMGKIICAGCKWLLLLSFLVYATNVMAQQRVAENATDYISAKQPEPTVSGTVTNAQTGDPMIGVNILVVGTSTGTVTNANGHYSLNVPSLQDTLRFSFIGFQTQTVPIDGRTTIDVALKSKVISGKQLIVTAFGQKKSKLRALGAVESIKSPSKTLKIPSSSLTNAFAGRMTGVIAFQRSGQPGKNASRFYIRGISTFSGSTSPLIIIDGVEATVDDLNSLSPEAIKGFSILKDATATAVYGTRGANGVMLVKTKLGANLSHPHIHIRIENSVISPTIIPKYADGVTFMKTFNEAVRSRDARNKPYSKQKIEGTRNHLNKFIFPDVNWYKALFKKRSMRQSININVRGGGEKVTYYMGSTYDRETGMLRSFHINSFSNNVKLNRFVFQNNLGVHLSQSTQLNLKLNTQLRMYHRPGQSVYRIFGNVMFANPVSFPKLFPTNNAINKGRPLYGGSITAKGRGGTNPFGDMVNGYADDFHSTVRGNIMFKQDLNSIIKGLSFSGHAAFRNFSKTTTVRTKGYNRFYVKSYAKTDSGYTYNLEQIGNGANLSLVTSNSNIGNRAISLQAQIHYKRQITENQHISALFVFNQRSYSINDPTNLIQSLPQRNRAFAWMLSYAYNNTYLAEINVGYDGSGGFAAGYRYGLFPSYAAGIVLSNERFWQPIKPVVNLFKIRVSWGKVGSADIGSSRFVYKSIVSLHSKLYTTGREQDASRTGFKVYRFANPHITWEVANKLNIGLDLIFLHSLDLTVNFFRQNRKNIFLQRQTLPSSLGTFGTSIFGNLGRVVNKGLEAQLNYSHSFSDNFFMSVKGVFTYAHNEIKDIDEPAFLTNPNLSQVGYPIGSPLVLKAEHLFIDQAEINHSPDQRLGGTVMPGDIKYKDVNGDGHIDSNDRVDMGYPSIPEIEYGLGLSFKYKNFDLSFLIEGVAHRSIFLSGIQPFGSLGRKNVMQFIADDHWSVDYEDIYARYPRLSVNNNLNNTQPSSKWMRNGSYIRLKALELGYSFRMARIYFSAQNLWLISKFKLWDPELGGGNGLSYPIQRTLNIGVQLNFN